jgi:hypothetical protein
MTIDAVALLRGANLPLPSRLHVQKLKDATLVHTGVGFGGDLEMLAYGVRTSVGDALDVHDDPRGIFVLPDVAEPKADSYDGVIAEIGEAGEWVRKIAAGEVPATLEGAPAGSFEAMMGQAMKALAGTNLADIQRAIATGDYAAMAQLQERMAQALGGEEAMNQLASQLMGSANVEAAIAGRPMEPLAGFPELPIDLSKMNPEELAAMQKQLEGMLDPEQLAELEKLVKKGR